MRMALRPCHTELCLSGAAAPTNQLERPRAYPPGKFKVWLGRSICNDECQWKVSPYLKRKEAQGCA